MIQYIQVETNEKGKIIGLAFVDNMTGAYSKVKEKLSESSGLPEEAATENHIAEIERKAREEGASYAIIKRELAKESGLKVCSTTEEHISKIEEAAENRGARLRESEWANILAEHSGLAPSNAISDHIAAIKLKAYNQGYDKGWHDKQADIQKRIKQFEEAIKESIENE